MDDIRWFIGFLVIIAVMWLTGASLSSKRPATQTATSTPQARTVSKAPPASKATTKSSGTSQRPAAQSKPPQQNGSLGLPQGYVIYETTLPAPLAPDTSYLRGKLFISSVRRSSKTSQEYVVVQASAKNTFNVPISGLTLKSKVTTLEGEIPKGWGLPFPTNQGEGDVVVLRPGEKAYIISGRSPNGQSFRLNTCTGYFERGMNFFPSLPLQCPRPIDEPRPSGPNTLSDTCLDYLKKLPRCQVPPSSVPVALRSDGSCQAFLFNKINYNQCVTNHRNDRTFFKGEWRLYLGRNSRLWKDKSEIIELLDENDRVIDRETLR